MIRCLFFALIPGFILPDLSGQNLLPVFPMFDLQPGLYNPALTSGGGRLNLSLQGSEYDRPAQAQSYHGQFAFSLTGTLISNRKSEIAFGLFRSGIRSQYQDYFSTDGELSSQQTANYRVNISYSRKLDRGSLSAGINMDRYLYSIHLPEYWGCFSYSPEINQSWKFLNSGVGAAYNSYRTNFLLGLSCNLIFPTRLNFDNRRYTPFRREINLNTGIDIRLHRNLIVRPMLFASNNYAFVSSVLFKYRERYLCGIGYNAVGNQAGLRCGYQAERLGLHYNYNLPTSYYYWFPASEHSAGITYAID
jgi:hypothetical protein